MKGAVRRLPRLTTATWKQVEKGRSTMQQMHR